MAKKMFQISENDLAKYGQAWSKMGINDGFILAEAFLNQKAGEAFAKGRDPEAQKIRELASSLSKIRESEDLITEGADGVQSQIFKETLNRPVITNHPKG